MLAFLTNMVLFFSYLSKSLGFFYTDYEKYAIVELSTKKKIICDTGSINVGS